MYSFNSLVIILSFPDKLYFIYSGGTKLYCLRLKIFRELQKFHLFSLLFNPINNIPFVCQLTPQINFITPADQQHVLFSLRSVSIYTTIWTYCYAYEQGALFLFCPSFEFNSLNVIWHGMRQSPIKIKQGIFINSSFKIIK